MECSGRLRAGLFQLHAGIAVRIIFINFFELDLYRVISYTRCDFRIFFIVKRRFYFLHALVARVVLIIKLEASDDRGSSFFK